MPGPSGGFGSFSTPSSCFQLSGDQPFDAYNDADEERDTNFVLAVLNESRHSLKLLDCHCDEASENTTIVGAGGSNGSAGGSDRTSNAGQAEAMTLVNRLLSAKLVYRTMHEPVGNVQLAAGPHQAYSVRGYFMPNLGEGYQFISNTPLRQYWHIDGDVRNPF